MTDPPRGGCDESTDLGDNPGRRMQIPRVPHPWSLSPREAVAVQRRLASRVLQTRPTRKLRFVAGLDAAFLGKERCIAGVGHSDVPVEPVVFKSASLDSES